MDKIIKMEILLNFLNSLLSKAIFYKDTKIISELTLIRHNIYYSPEFNYELTFQALKIQEEKLSKYD